MTRIRRFGACLIAIVVCLQASCAVVPPNHLVQANKASLGRVALVASRFNPSYRFEAITTGKGDAAGKTAATGALSCTELLRGGGAASGIAAGFVALVFLACLPVAATVGAIHGASQAASAHRVEEAKAAAQRAIAALKLQSEAVEAALRYGEDRGLQIGRLQQIMGPAAPDASPSYVHAQEIADSVVEISVLEAYALSTGERQQRISFGMQARVRVVAARDGKVIDTLTLHYRSDPPRSMEEWLSADGHRIKAEFDRGSAAIAEQVIDEILLIYHPKSISQEESDTTERVPAYTLRAIEPPIRNKVYWSSRMTYGHLERYPLSELQPTFRWESWPRGFDIAPGRDQGQAHEVSYDLRILSEAGPVYERRGLLATAHRLEQPLAPCKSYRWTVRARFMLNGIPRATEWMGAYNTIGGAVAPWWWRRGSGVPALYAIPASVESFYPILETPGSDGKACPGL